MSYEFLVYSEGDNCINNEQLVYIILCMRNIVRFLMDDLLPSQSSETVALVY